MKKLIVASAISVAMAMSVSTGFAKSKIDGKVMNQSRVDKSANIAIGKDNKARMGSVAIKNSEVGKTGVVSNKARISKSANIAIGKGNTANMGSIAMEGSKVDGKVLQFAACSRHEHKSERHLSLT